MLISCSSPMVPGASLTEKADNLYTWGYDSISVFMDLSDWNERTEDELQRLEENTGVRPGEFVLIDDIYGHAMDDDANLRRKCREMYFEAAAVCARLNAVTEIEYQYGPQHPMPLFDPYVQLSTEKEDSFVEFYSEMLAVVEGSDALVLIEPLNRYESRYLNTVHDAGRIVDRVNHRNAGLLPDVFHMSIEESDIPAAIASAGARAKHVHLADNNRLLPGYGTLDWEAIFGALRAIDFDGIVNLESSTSGDPRDTLPAVSRRLKELAGTV